MKIYKHKNLGRIAKYISDYDYNSGGDVPRIAPGYELWSSEEDYQLKNYKNCIDVLSLVELIENSSDWEIAIEQDRIGNIINNINTRYREYDLGNSDDVVEFIELINKHLPRITDDMIEEMRNDYMNSSLLHNKLEFIEAIKQNLPKDLLVTP